MRQLGSLLQLLGASPHQLAISARKPGIYPPQPGATLPQLVASLTDPSEKQETICRNHESTRSDLQRNHDPCERDSIPDLLHDRWITDLVIRRQQERFADHKRKHRVSLKWQEQIARVRLAAGLDDAEIPVVW